MDFESSGFLGYFGVLCHIGLLGDLGLSGLFRLLVVRVFYLVRVLGLLGFTEDFKKLNLPSLILVVFMLWIIVQHFSLS